MTSSVRTYPLKSSQDLIFSNSQSKIYTVEIEESQERNPESAVLKVTDPNLSEAKMHKQASDLSEHVVKYFHSYTSNQKTHILMEHCQNGSVYDLIKSRAQRVRYLDTCTIKTYLANVLSAVSALHSNSIVHRDIKPDNMYIDLSSNIKLGDFGCCQKANRRSPIQGSPLYLPPELSASNNTNTDLFKCDVWSLGKSFFELCTLRTHLEFDEFFSDENKFISFIDRQLRDVNPNIRLVLKAMLRINPTDRVTPQQALEMLQSGKKYEEVISLEGQTTDDDCTATEFLGDFDDLPVNNILNL